MLDQRMKSICDALRSGVTVCDVGTDHAIIPIELISSGKASKCIITDISAPSLQKGVNNAKKASCKARIVEYCTNGTLNVPFDSEMDFIMAGMGGELISQILEQDERLKNGAYRFVLQPMSRAEELREYLAENGFSVINEIKTESLGRIYPIISCQYTGNPYILSIAMHRLGFERAQTELEIQYAQKTLTSLQTRLAGLKKAETPDVDMMKITEEQIDAIQKAM